MRPSPIRSTTTAVVRIPPELKARYHCDRRIWQRALENGLPMAVDHIRYDILAQDALRGVVRTVVQDAAKNGLPGEHHFYISFDTRAQGVRLSPRMLAQYPEEMTVVLQHQFWDLVVTEDGFEVGLSFGGVPERLAVPFAAIKADRIDHRGEFSRHDTEMRRLDPQRLIVGVPLQREVAILKLVFRAAFDVEHVGSQRQLQHDLPVKHKMILPERDLRRTNDFAPDVFQVHSRRDRLPRRFIDGMDLQSAFVGGICRCCDAHEGHNGNKLMDAIHVRFPIRNSSTLRSLRH